MLNNFVKKAGVKKITTAQSNTIVGGAKNTGGVLVYAFNDAIITNNRPPSQKKRWKDVG